MTAKERFDRQDRPIAAIREVIHGGMRLLLETRKDARRELIAARKRGVNGHSKAKLDLQ